MAPMLIEIKATSEVVAAIAILNQANPVSFPVPRRLPLSLSVYVHQP